MSQLEGCSGLIIVEIVFVPLFEDFDLNVITVRWVNSAGKVIARGLKLLRAARNVKSLNRCVVYTLPNDSSRSTLSYADEIFRKLAGILLLKSPSRSKIEERVKLLLCLRSQR